MKKVLGTMSGFIAAGFSIAVLALLMSLTYGALQRIFPDSFSNQMWGLVMFDIAAMCWALIFVFQSKSVGQYAASGIGFIVAFLGTLGMVAAEVMLSGADLAQVDTAQIGKWMIYGFIVVTAIHALLVYVHHGTAPEIHEQINVGVARGEIVTEAISQATRTLEAQKAELAQTIHQDIVSQVKRDLGLYPVQDTVFDRRRNEPAPSWLARMRGKFRRPPLPSPVTYEQTAQQGQLRNPEVTDADILAAKSINPLAAPYRACPNCGDNVPLTVSHCYVCETKMPPLPQPQEDAGATDAPFPAGE